MISIAEVATVTVDVKKCLNTSNCFSPNGDGNNDTWVLRGMDKFPNASVIVYNRYGNQLFKTSNAQDPWDGTFNGKKLPIATYFYIIDLGDNKTRMNGTVNIIR